MKTHLVSGGCGFVGRNMVKRLYKDTSDRIIFIDDLSVGIHPSEWEWGPTSTGAYSGQGEKFGDDDRLLYFKEDFRHFMRRYKEDPDFLKRENDWDVRQFGDVHHFAAIVGGRAKIDGDPIKVALDLSIDAEFFEWVAEQKPERVMYPSSSAAYPVDLQQEGQAIALKESDINFDNMGRPDMTYGWSKLTGEYLAQITAQHYGIPVTCIRPFSGYGEDQDLSYPIPAIATRAALKEEPFEVWGTGKQGRDFVHIDDVLDCTLLAMDHIQDGSAINIGQGRLTTFLEIIDLFTEFAGYDPDIQPLTDKPVGVHARYCDMSYVKETLGWEPRISIREGMKRVYDRAVEKYAS